MAPSPPPGLRVDCRTPVVELLPPLGTGPVPVAVLLRLLLPGRVSDPTAVPDICVAFDTVVDFPVGTPEGAPDPEFVVWLCDGSEAADPLLPPD